MVAVPSTMQALGSPAQFFSLPDVRAANNEVSLQDFVGQPLLVMFICNHCPFVIHIVEQMVALANNAQAQGFRVVAVSSNDTVAYPQDGPELMAEFAREWGFEFPYLFDESQEVAKRFGAACTPDFFIYDANHRLQYRGQMDGSRPGNGIPVTGHDLRSAIDLILAGKVVAEEQTPSIGCNIKWRAGNEPDYF